MSLEDISEPVWSSVELARLVYSTLTDSDREIRAKEAMLQLHAKGVNTTTIYLKLHQMGSWQLSSM